jgi:hypothetical protein
LSSPAAKAWIAGVTGGSEDTGLRGVEDLGVGKPSRLPGFCSGTTSATAVDSTTGQLWQVRVSSSAASASAHGFKFRLGDGADIMHFGWQPFGTVKKTDIEPALWPRQECKPQPRKYIHWVWLLTIYVCTSSRECNSKNRVRNWTHTRTEHFTLHGRYHSITSNSKMISQLSFFASGRTSIARISG